MKRLDKAASGFLVSVCFLPLLVTSARTIRLAIGVLWRSCERHPNLLLDSLLTACHRAFFRQPSDHIGILSPSQCLAQAPENFYRFMVLRQSIDGVSGDTFRGALTGQRAAFLLNDTIEALIIRCLVGMPMQKDSPSASESTVLMGWQRPVTGAVSLSQPDSRLFRM